MTCDFGVWSTGKVLSNEEAGELYGQLCDGITDGVLPTPAIEAFYGELTAMHPDLDDIPDDKVDDLEQSPWSCGLGRSSGHVLMNCRWSRAEYCYGLIHELACKHGLTFFDPQSGVVHDPDLAKPSTRRQCEGLPWNGDGNVIRRIATAGSDISRPMVVDFQLALPDRGSAFAAMLEARNLGYTCEVDQDDDSETWTCTCSRSMTLDYNTLLTTQAELDLVAEKHGGKSDGWGTFGNAPAEPAPPPRQAWWTFWWSWFLPK